jgi:hypothetical protein
VPPKFPGSPQITAEEPEQAGSRRDPEERPVEAPPEHQEKLLDKTLADSFPTSDPPSTVQDASYDSALQDRRKALLEKLIQNFPADTWLAISIDDQRVVGVGTSSQEAEEKAKQDGHLKLWLIQVPEDAPNENPNKAA